MFRRDLIPGLVLVFGLAALAILSAPLIPRMNEVLLGLLFGVAIGNLPWRPDTLRPGISFSGQTILNAAIVFLGFGISFRSIATLGSGTLILLILTVGIMILLTWALARWFRCRTTTGWLVGFGTAICGSSAIAALSGSVTREKEDVGIALAVVNLLGLAGMLVLPAIAGAWMENDIHIGTLLGGTLHAVGNVAGAGYALDDRIGDLALIVKLGRVALLVPGLVLFNLLAHTSAPLRERLAFPAYLWGFLGAVALVSWAPIPAELLHTFKTLGKWLLTMAMIGIGYGIRIRQLYTTGRIALGFGLVIFLIQVAVVLALSLVLI